MWCSRLLGCLAQNLLKAVVPHGFRRAVQHFMFTVDHLCVVSNLTETELSWCKPHDVQRKVWTAQGTGQETDWQPQCTARLSSQNAAWPWVGFYILLDIFLSQLYGISFVLAFSSLLHLWWLCRSRSDKKLIQLGAPVPQPCIHLPQHEHFHECLFFILKPRPGRLRVCCWALWCCPRALSALCQAWLGGGNGSSALGAWAP